MFIVEIGDVKSKKRQPKEKGVRRFLEEEADEASDSGESDNGDDEREIKDHEN